MNDSERLQEILYLLRLREWREARPHMSGICDIAWNSAQIHSEDAAYARWVKSAPKKEEC